MSDDEFLDFIKHSCDQTVVLLADNGVENDWGVGALKWLEALVDAQRAQLTEEERERYVITIGAYLGECLCRTPGGRWVKHDFGWAVELENKLLAFPFNKVGKYVDGGEGDSFSSFFAIAPTLGSLTENRKRGSALLARVIDFVKRLWR